MKTEATFDVEEFATGYATAMIWANAAIGEDGRPVEFGPGDAESACLNLLERMDLETVAAMRKDAEEFATDPAVSPLLERAVSDDYPANLAGHDLALNRNGHGAGFWDRGLPGTLGTDLSDHARALGEAMIWGPELPDGGEIPSAWIYSA